MTTPTWNQITAPNFSAGNYLIAQAMEQLSKATTGFKSIADQYKDTIQKRNLGLIQEYVNSAKTPEELQSEAFKTGLAKITDNMGGDYDTLAKAQLVDKAYDSLLSRKANQVSIARNEFGLDQDKLKAPTELDLLKTQALAAKENYDFAIQNNPLTLRTNTVAADVAERTKETQVAQALANLNNTNSTISAREKELKLREQELGIQRLKALSDGGGFTLQNGEAAISDIIGGVRKIHQDALSGASDRFSYKDMDAVDKAIIKDETWPSLGLPDTAKKIKELITKNPELAKLPNPVKASMYMSAVAKIREGNVFGKDDWLYQNDEKYLNAVIDAAKENTGYLTNAQRMETAALQDGANRLSRMSQGKVSYLQAYAYLQSQLGASPLTNMSVNEEALDNLRKSGTKNEPVVIPQATLGSSLDGGAAWFKPNQKSKPKPSITTVEQLDALVNKEYKKDTLNFDPLRFINSLDIDPLLKEAYYSRE